MLKLVAEELLNIEAIEWLDIYVPDIEAWCLIHKDFVHDEKDSMIGWLDGKEWQLDLNKPVLPPWSASFIARVVLGWIQSNG